MKQHQRHLSDRDRRILEFVVHYRIGTDRLLQRQCFSPPTSLENVNRVLLRLERRRLLRRATEKNGFCWYGATRRTLAILGQTPRTPRPLTEQTLPIVLSVATYCVAKGVHRLTSRQFQDRYPELWRPGMRSSNYVVVDVDGRLRLEMLIVDRGGAAHRIHSRVRRVIAQRKGLPKFASLMKSGRFRITVLTGTPEQQHRIQRRLSRRSYAPVELTTFAIPELADLLISRR